MGTMTHDSRLKRLKQMAAARRSATPTRRVVVWCPYKVGGDPPGDYPSPDGGYMRIVYRHEAAEAPIESAEAGEVRNADRFAAGEE
jgi:hypothetical protein